MSQQADHSRRYIVADPETHSRKELSGWLQDFAHVVATSTVSETFAALKRQTVDAAVLTDTLASGDAFDSLLASIAEHDNTLPIVLLKGDTTQSSTANFSGASVSKDSVHTNSGCVHLLLLLDRLVLAAREQRHLNFHNGHNERAAVSASNLFIGKSRAAATLRQEVRAAADTDLNVLITGETGVGKSLVAEAIHYAHPIAKDRPFVAVDPAALPPSLFESELFGHAKGAFTGATRAQVGAFEAAQGGTLFLDEIGDLPQSLQVKLLRAVETKIIRRLGDGREMRLAVRIIAATNRDLHAEVGANQFRMDLYQRLNEIRLHVPPLRERSEDITLLVEHFLGEFSGDLGVSCELHPSAVAYLENYRWPGNVRELRTLVRRLIHRGIPPVLTESSLLPLFPARVDRGQESGMLPEERIALFSRRVYMDELGRCGYSIRQAARQLEVPYHTLRSRLKSLGLLEVLRQRRSESES
ncbi:MAG: sigma-54 dependent transcriptional regulator [Myxococcota bacterium]